MLSLLYNFQTIFTDQPIFHHTKELSVKTGRSSDQFLWQIDRTVLFSTGSPPEQSASLGQSNRLDYSPQTDLQTRLPSS